MPHLTLQLHPLLSPSDVVTPDVSAATHHVHAAQNHNACTFATMVRSFFHPAFTVVGCKAGHCIGETRMYSLAGEIFGSISAVDTWYCAH